MASRIENGAAFKLTVLTAAIGAGTMGTAGAATISKAPAGFTPLVISSNSGSSTSFDTDGDGTLDFTITTGTGTNGYISLTALSGATFSAFGSVYSYASPDSFAPVTNLKSNSGGSLSLRITGTSNEQTSSYFSPGVPSYAELATNVTYSSNGNSIVGGMLGYIMGTRSIVSGAGTNAEVDTFTIADYGVIGATAVPEPSSLALLALGGAGVAALRRRRARSPHAA